MPITWPEALLLAAALAALALAGNVVAGMISENLRGQRRRTVVLAVILFVVAATGVTAYQTMRGQPADPEQRGGATPTASTPTSPAVIPGGTSTAKVGAPAATAQPSPARRTGEYVVSVESPTTSTLPNNVKTPTYRYWYYPSADDVIGEISYRNSGGYAGMYGRVPAAAGKECAVPYVTFMIVGIPHGTYDVSTYVPDISDLATAVKYGDKVIDQSAYRGSWAPLGRFAVDEEGLTVTQSQDFESHRYEDGCRRSGKWVVFDTIRAVRV